MVLSEYQPLDFVILDGRGGGGGVGWRGGDGSGEVHPQLRYHRIDGREPSLVPNLVGMQGLLNGVDR